MFYNDDDDDDAGKRSAVSCAEPGGPILKIYT